MAVLGCVLYGAAVLLPVCRTLTGSVGLELGDLIINRRRLLLLANSLKLGGATAVIACLIGLLCALFIRNSSLHNKWYRYFFILFLPVPYYIYALSWMYLTRFLANWWPAMLRYSMQGVGACLFVEVLTYLPLAALFFLIALESINTESEKMALIYRSPVSVLFRNVLPEISLYVAAAAGCIFTLSVTDFSVPSMFQYNTYALEIFSVFGRTGNALQAGLLAWPLLLISGVPVLMMAHGGSRIGFPQVVRQNTRRRYPALFSAGIRLAFFLVCIQVAVPVVVFALYSEGLDNLLHSYRLISEQLATSMGIAAIAAVMALVLAAGPAVLLSKTNSLTAWALSMLPLIFPGALLAMGLLSAVNGSLFHWVSQTMLFPALGCAVRYMPFAVLILAASIRHLDKRRLEMANIMATDEMALIRLVFQMLLPGMLCAGGLMFFLTAGEEGIMLVLMPPGLETASVKIYNYLHYGASQYVSGFCLVSVIAMLAIELIAIVMADRYRKGGRNGRQRR